MKKWFKRVSAAVLTLFLILMMSVSVFAATVTKDSAVKTALKDAGLKKCAVTSLKSKKDDGNFEIKFKKKSTGEKYEYEISTASGKILEKEVEYTHKRNTSKQKISRKKALKRAAKASGIALSTVRKGSCSYKKEDGEWIYEVKFKSGKYKYEYEILAPTGKIIGYEKERK